MKKILIFGLFEMDILTFSVMTILVISLFGACNYRVYWLTSVENYEYAYRWDRTNGNITRINHTGWCKVTPFYTKVYTIDSRPIQIRIEANSNGQSNPGVNNRVLNAKLVQFDPKGASQFFEYHGLANYDQQQLSEILKIYAYENFGTSQYNADSLQKKYKFLKILSETAGSGIAAVNEPKKDTTHGNINH